MPQFQIQCATWNVHRAKGTDGRRDPDRIASCIESALAPERLDILSLQEADEECPPHARVLDVARISEATGMDYQHDDPRMRWGPQSDGFLGTILFLHPRFDVLHRDVLDLPGHCHRGVVILDIVAEDKRLRIVSGHLSLSQPLRLFQMRTVGQYLFRRPSMPTLLLGDFNEWRPWGGMMFSRYIVGRRFSGPGKATFPSTRPLLPLDRIKTDVPGASIRLKALRNSEFVHASDHLPLLGEITFP